MSAIPAPRTPSFDEVPHIVAWLQGCNPRSGALGPRPWSPDSPQGPTLQLQRLSKGQTAFSQGDHLARVHAVQAGQFKTSCTDRHGRSQITGFPMSGEMLGLDSFGLERHQSDAVALESALVITLPCNEFKRLVGEHPGLQNAFQRLLSLEVERLQSLLLLNNGPAQSRIAGFLLEYAGQLQSKGWSHANLHLRMSREEIGSYVGLKMETVSRAFSGLQAAGVLHIKGRHVQVLKSHALRMIADAGH
jgi:CRP/FNR family transcriptional regulator